MHVDASVVALYKPARMHSAPLPSGGGTPGSLCDWAFQRFPELRLAAGDPRRPVAEGGLLHRLDFETSGLVLFARTPEAHAFLLAEQAAGRFLKEYRSLVLPSANPGLEGSRPRHGEPSGLPQGGWAAALAAEAELEALSRLLGQALAAGRRPLVTSSFRPFGPGAARVACIAYPGQGGRRASGGGPAYRTELLAAQAGEGGLELRLGLVRGFRHQIRAHLAWIGLPILGDSLYGGASWERLCLDAGRLSFTHPEGGELSIEA